MKKALWLVFFSSLLFACVSTRAVKLGGGPMRRPIYWDKVAVYRTAEQVPGKYEEVALLIATGDTMWTNEGNMWKSLQKKAGMMGANGIILDATSEPKAGTKLVAALFGVGTERKGKAIAIFVLPAGNE